ncbi:MAG: hypothetical protein ABW328_04680 [Ilumatobacteraceae bacterium]
MVVRLGAIERRTALHGASARNHHEHRLGWDHHNNVPPASHGDDGTAG